MAAATELAQRDLITVDPISAVATLSILPPGKKKRQKVVVGDDSGSVTCVEMKKNAVPSSVFKTLPTDTPVSALALGGPIGKKDRIYISSGQQLRGVSKSGKQFWVMSTSMAETIKTMVTEETRIWAATDYIYTLLDNGEERASYMPPDKVNQLMVENITRETEYDAVLGCADRFVRVVQGSLAAMEAAVEEPVTAVARFSNRGVVDDPMFSEFKAIIFGSSSGSLGQLLVDSSTMRRGWAVSATEGKTREARVNVLSSGDLIGDGADSLVVGRDDGTIHVLSVEDEPTVRWTTNIGESVRAVECGEVTSPGYLELVVAGFSGRVQSFTTESLSAVDPTSAVGLKLETVEKQAQIQRLREELIELKETVKTKKDKLARVSGEYVPMDKVFNVHHSFSLDPDDAAYKLNIEIPIDLEVVALQSSIPVDLLDSEGTTAICSRSEADPENGNMLLATYRCQESCKRLEISMRTVEGQYGDLLAFVVARLSPKTAQVIRMQIKPLSLHHRVNDEPTDVPMSRLKITGTFTLAQMHEWVNMCLPEVPARIQGDGVDMVFRNAYIGSQLVCRYRKGEAVFASDSLSTIAILKEVIAKQATSRKVHISFHFDIKEECVPHFLRLVDPKLAYTFSLARKVELIDSLKEIKLQERDVSFLAPQYQEVIRDAERFKKEFKHRPKALEMLYGLVTDLYVDRFKFKGLNVTHKIPELMEILDRYDYDEVVAFFNAGGGTVGGGGGGGGGGPY